MLKRLSTLLLFCLAVSLLAGFSWDDKDFQILQRSALFRTAQETTVEKYPDADAVILDSVVSVRYEADGTSLQVHDMATKIMTEKGQESSRTVTSWYNASYSRAKIALVQIIKPSGVVVNIDLQRNTKEMIDPSSMQSNIYSTNDKLIEVTVPGIEIGDILRCIYVDQLLKPRVPNSFSDYIQLEYPIPVCHKKVVIDAPPTLPLKSILVKSPQGKGPTATQTTQNGRRVYTWEVSNVPQAFEEPCMPPMYMNTQLLLVSTFDSWQQVSKWYYQLSVPHLKSNDEIRAKVRELVGSETDKQKIISAIFTFVSQQIRYMGTIAEAEAPGYEPHDVSLTFSQRAGVCRDKAALLATMLNDAGLEAYPVLIHAGNKLVSEVPTPYFNHAITAVRDSAVPGGYILMDSTDETTRELLPSYLSDKSFLVATPEGDSLRTTAIAPYSENELVIVSNGRLEDDGTISVSSSLEFNGINDNAYRGFFLGSTPEQRHQFVSRQIKRRIPGAQLQGLKISPSDLQDTTQPLKLQIRFTAPSALTIGKNENGKESDVALLRLPQLSSSFGMINFVFQDATLNKRRFPFLTDYPCAVSEELSLALPQNLRPESIPDFPRLDTSTLRWQRQIDCRPGRIYLSNLFASKGVLFTPEEYTDLKVALRDFETANRRQPIFRIVAEDEQEEDIPSIEVDSEIQPDAEILDLSSVFTLDSANAWTNEQTYRIKVLTYSGVKDNSDLHWSYNPAWCDLELVYARVINGDEVQEITPQLIHRMDAEWVSSAPRYPAGKTLVANLPGVAIGSIIEYKVKRTWKDRYFFSFITPLRSSYPIHNFRVDMYAPKDLDLSPEFMANGWLDLPCKDGSKPVELITSKYDVPQNRVKYSWYANNIQPLRKEDNLPPAPAYLPTLAISTGNWKQFATNLNAVVQSLGDGGDTIKKLGERFRGYPENVKIVQIRRWMEQNVRTAGPSFNEVPITCLTRPEITAKDGYGNSADRAILFLALLRAAGIKDCQLLLGTPLPEYPQLKKFYQRFPTATTFSSWVVLVNGEDGEIWLNDQNQYAQFGTCAYDRGMLLDLKSGVLSTMELEDKYRDQIKQRMELEVHNDGSATFTSKDTIQGTAFGELKQFYVQLPPEERRRHYQTVLAELSQNAKPITRDLITDFKMYPGALGYKAKITDFAVLEGNHCHFRLPISIHAPLMALASTETRNYPLYLRAAQKKNSEITIVLPDNFPKILMVPSDITWKAPAGAGTISWKCRLAGRSATGAQKLTFTYNVDMNPAVIPPTAYPEILDAIQRLQAPAATTILLEKAPEKVMSETWGWVMKILESLPLFFRQI